MKLKILLASLLLVCVAQQPSAGSGPDFKRPIGLQLYSLREQFKQDVGKTLDQVRAFGITNVELAGTYGVAPAKFREQLDARHIKAVSSHFSYEQCRDDIEGVVRDAQFLGVEYAGCAWIPHTDPFDEKTCREAAAVFNRAGAASGSGEVAGEIWQAL